ncbi:MAG TPA: LytTR family DNA-binding domain-containing protein, partial [Chitinophagaceae bacterium]
MKVKCFIIEDEPLAQNVLRKYIEDYPLLELSGVYKDALEAQKDLYEIKPELLFLDINLPVISGINFLKTLNQPPLVIFTTAYPDYAIEGFELNAVDYLLKPFSYERILKAVHKVIDRISTTENRTNEDSIFLKVDKKAVRVNVDEIYYLEALDDYIKVVTENKTYLINSTLKNMQQELPEHKFIRVHKSYLVAREKIDYIEGNYIRI